MDNALKIQATLTGFAAVMRPMANHDVRSEHLEQWAQLLTIMDNISEECAL